MERYWKDIGKILERYWKDIVKIVNNGVNKEKIMELIEELIAEITTKRTILG